jgi:glycosyltransferase involved in cell wall biosynthesis
VAEYVRQHAWVRALGYQDRSQLLEYVSAFDIGLYPRRGDVGGRASVKVLEYMACGVPVAGFNVGEMQIALRPGAGVSASSPELLAEEIVGIARDANLRRRMGEIGREAVRAFDWDALATRYKALLEEAVQP